MKVVLSFLSGEYFPIHTRIKKKLSFQVIFTGLVCRRTNEVSMKVSMKASFLKNIPNETLRFDNFDKTIILEKKSNKNVVHSLTSRMHLVFHYCKQVYRTNIATF